MKRPDLLKLGGLVLLLGVAGFLVFRQISTRSAPGERGFFYDVSAQRIFTAARTAVPPIRGVDGPDLDGFRAVVFSATGKPQDRSSWRVAYLEKCTPELKRKMEEAQAAGTALAMGRVEAQNHRLVRRLTDTDWVPMSDPAADAILNSWATPGPDGITPVLCTP